MLFSSGRTTKRGGGLPQPLSIRNTLFIKGKKGQEEYDPLLSRREGGRGGGGGSTTKKSCVSPLIIFIFFILHK